MNIRKKISKISLLIFGLLFVFGLINISSVSAQVEESNLNTAKKLSQEELDMKSLEANAVAQAVLLAIKNGALGEQFLNTNPSLNPSINSLPDNTVLENQAKIIDAMQASVNSVNQGLKQMLRVVIILWCFVVAQFVFILFLFYFSSRKENNK
ncbi:MAG: hypothetical protein Q7T50_00575 [Candidatus Magasanikbacteria bacterium]|nr:hypothetical protein [Candidatus Magasanikbacteria bacterium]